MEYHQRAVLGGKQLNRCTILTEYQYSQSAENVFRAPRTSRRQLLHVGLRHKINY